MYTKLIWIIAVALVLIESRISLADLPVVVSFPGELCGMTTFTGPKGVINSPNGTFPTWTNATCDYRITVDEENSVSLRFLYFDLPTHLNRCNRNWMTITCPLDESFESDIGRRSQQLCGQSKWTSALRLYDCPVLLVNFVFDDRLILDGRGFRLEYEITPTAGSNVSDANRLPELECGQTSFNNQTGTISLPTNPNISLAKVNCTYTISPNEVEKIIASLTLDVSFFDLLTLTDELDECTQDYLQITCTNNDGSQESRSRCRRFASMSLLSPEYHNCLKVEIILQSDNYDPRNMRQITYDMILEDAYEDDEVGEEDYRFQTDDHDRGQNAVCGNTTFMGPTGNVTSPLFPLAYPHGLNCTYRILAGRKKFLFLKFLTFDLEGDFSSGICAFDWIRISCLVNGTPTENPSTLRRLCGQIKWSSALRYSNCSSVQVQFYADLSVSKGGFKIQYTTRDSTSYADNVTEAVCGKTDFNESYGVITLPTNPTGYMMQMNCTYSLFADNSSTFSLNLSSLNITNMKHHSDRCIEISCRGEVTWKLNLCQFFSYPYDYKRKPEFYNCQTLQLSLASEFYDIQEVYRILFEVTPTKSICGNTSFSESTGIISHPNFTSYYPVENSNCTYSISGGINTTISISFSKPESQYIPYSICRQWITMSCLESSVFSPYANKRFCYQMKWPSFIRFFNCSALLLTYSIDPRYKVAGFRLNYTVSDAESLNNEEIFPELRCGRLDTSYSSSITLPYEAGLPVASLNCTLSILPVSKSKSQLSIDFRQYGRIFGYSGDDCGQSYLMISCSSLPDINSTKYCRDTILGTVTNFSFANCNAIRLSLRSSVYYPNQYYASVDYKFTNYDCGTTLFVNRSGNITSTGFPLPYPNNLNCLYNIDVGDNKTVTLEFLTFELPGSLRLQRPIYPHSDDVKFGDEHHPYPSHRYDSCHSDRLIIRCLSDLRTVATNPILDRPLCNNRTERVKLHDCRTVRLEFTSGRFNFHSSLRRFNIHYEILDSRDSDELCGNNSFVEPSGIITSPGFGEEHLEAINCTYFITAGHNRSVMLEILHLDLPHGLHSVKEGRWHDDCNRGWLQISCSSQETAFMNPVENRMLCGFQRPFTVMLRGCEQISLSFNSGSDVQLKGFNIRYTILAAGGECGNTVFSNNTGKITSPGFPSPYPPHINCRYQIVVGSKNSVSLLFFKFDIGHRPYNYHTYYRPSITSNHTECPNDWVQVECLSRDLDELTDMSQYLNKTLCGIKTPFSMNLTGCRRVAVEFSANGNYSKPGFQIQYQISKLTHCGYNSTNFTDVSGTIASPSFTMDRRQQNISCTYFISAHQISTITLAIVALQQYPYCYNDWLLIRCLTDNSTELYNYSSKLCGNKYQMDQVIFPSCSAVQLRHRSATYEPIFVIKYTVEEDVCGNTLFAKLSGIITFPKSSPNYATKFNCSYSIFATSFSTIWLVVSSFGSTIGANEICPDDWLLIFCRSEELKENYKITHSYCNQSEVQTSLKFSECSVIDIIFHSESVVSRRNFNMFYTIASSYASPATDSTATTKISGSCPKDCQTILNETFCKCPITQTDQMATESFHAGHGQNFVGSKSFKFLTALIVILVVVTLLVLSIIWLRKRSLKQREDETTLTTEDTDRENETSQANTRRGKSFFSFRSKRNQSGPKGYVPLASLSSDRSNESKTIDVSNDEISTQK